MIRSVCLAALILGLPAGAALTPAYAQSSDQTDQTDQAEEDWRRSQRKRTRDDDIEDILNPRSTGAGPNLPPLRTIDTLPEESRRHLQQQRAKVIAEVEFGEEIPEYEPSEAAQSDPQLAADEQEAWEVIVTDLQGTSGGEAQGEGGPNNVAVAGVGGGAPISVTRGGSTQSASEILAQLKGLRDSGARPGQGGGGTAPQPTGAQGGGTAPQGPLGGGSQTSGSPKGSGQTPAGQPGGSGQQAQNGPGQGAQPSGQPSGAQSGDPSGAQGKAAQGQSDGQGQSQAQGQSQGQSDGQGQAQGDGDAQGQSQGQSDGQSDGQSGDGGSAGGDAGNTGDSGASRQPEPLSPLEQARTTGPTSDASGARSSASDFLKDRQAQSTDE